MLKVPAILAAALAVAGVANRSDAALMLGAPNDGKLTLVYEPTNGNLTIVTDGNPYGTITLSATSSVFTDNVFGTTPEFYSDDDGFGRGLFFGVLVGQQTADVTLPGVLDRNQSQASLLAAISVQTVTNGPAPANITFMGGTTSAAVPEPTTLAALAGVGLVGLRRRRGA